jgi:tRNA dimethylallyltransferase
VVVGGTGLYVRALTHGLTPGPASDQALRDELAALPDIEALDRLKRADAAAYERIDRRNPRRVQRALETAILRRAQPADEIGANSTLDGIVETSGDSPLGIFLQRDRVDLHRRIAERTDEMFARGVLAEVAGIAPESVGPTAAQMIGWRECVAVGRGEMPLAEARVRINAATRQYAKRQTTWFKRETAFLPLMLEPGDSARATAARIAEDWAQLRSS